MRRRLSQNSEAFFFCPFLFSKDPQEKIAFDPDVTYKVRVRVRVEKDPSAKGEAFWAGVYDRVAKKGCGSISVKAERCGDGYAWYDVCKWKPRDGQYFWLGPGRFKKNGGVSAIKSVWVDRIEISRVSP